jgi:1,2-phenylacetyl-CoA epoxidase catalytic subunit
MGQTAAFVSWNRQTEPDTADAIQRRLCCNAVRQLATVQAYAAAVVHAPSLDDRLCAVERAREELQRLEELVELFRERFESEVLALVADETAHLSTPASWLEACTAQLALSLAARVDLCESAGLKSPFARLTPGALAEETEHLAAARAALEEMTSCGTFCAEDARGCLERWRAVALQTLATGEAQRAYLSELELTLHGVGLGACAGPVVLQAS